MKKFSDLTPLNTREELFVRINLKEKKSFLKAVLKKINQKEILVVVFLVFLFSNCFFRYPNFAFAPRNIIIAKNLDFKEEKEKLERLVEDLGLKDRVKFLGFIPDSELFEYYAACDIFAFPSWTSSGITPYEALAVGKKVVWTSEADQPILKEKHVFVANPNVEDFAKGLERAINAEVKGKLDLSQYTWDRYFETVYDAVLDAIS